MEINKKLTVGINIPLKPAFALMHLFHLQLNQTLYMGRSLWS